MRSCILAIWVTIKRYRTYSVLFTGPSIPWISEILSPDAQCSKKRKLFTECLLDYCSRSNFPNRNGDTMLRVDGI